MIILDTLCCRIFFSDFDIVACVDLFKGIQYTYNHETLGHFSWLDHFSISKLIERCEIIDSGGNLSDDLPIICKLNLPCATIKSMPCVGYSNVKRLYKDRWYKDRFEKADLLSHYNNSGLYLQFIDIPLDILHCTAECTCTIHWQRINSYYDAIVCALLKAGYDCVHRIPYNCLKPFWSDELDRFKEISIDIAQTMDSVRQT